MNSFNAVIAVNDLTLFSLFFTNMIPSRVHVSISLPSRRSWRASQAIFPRILVISSLMYIREPLSFRPFRMMALLVLCVVKEAMTTLTISSLSCCHIDCDGRWSRAWKLCPGHSTSLRVCHQTLLLESLCCAQRLDAWQNERISVGRDR